MIFVQQGPSLVGLVEQAFSHEGVDLGRVGLAWARASPAVALVPAFGLRAMPTAARGVLGLALAAVIFPALPPALPSTEPFWIRLLGELLSGVPVAVAAAVPLWAATMAGGVADTLRGSSESAAAPTVEGEASPLGIAFSILAAGIFLTTGGPARVAAALATGSVHASSPVLAASLDIASGISIAVAVGAPILVASIVVEVAGALIARAATPAQLHLLLAPLRALTLLGVLAVTLQRVSEVLAAVVVDARI